MTETATTEERTEEVVEMSAPSVVHRRRDWGIISIIASIAFMTVTVVISAIVVVIMLQADNDNTRRELKEEIHREVGDIREEIRDDNAATREDIRALSDNLESRLDSVERNHASLEGANNVLKDLLVAQPPGADDDGR